MGLANQATGRLPAIAEPTATSAIPQGLMPQSCQNAAYRTGIPSRRPPHGWTKPGGDGLGAPPAFARKPRQLRSPQGEVDARFVRWLAAAETALRPEPI